MPFGFQLPFQRWKGQISGCILFIMNILKLTQMKTISLPGVPVLCSLFCEASLSLRSAQNTVQLAAQKAMHEASLCGLIDELELATNLTTEEQSLLSPVSRTRADSDSRFQELNDEAETQLIDDQAAVMRPVTQRLIWNIPVAREVLRGTLDPHSPLNLLDLDMVNRVLVQFVLPGWRQHVASSSLREATGKGQMHQLQVLRHPRVTHQLTS